MSISLSTRKTVSRCRRWMSFSRLSTVRWAKIGSLQGMLRVANLPFVGSDVLASAACMDKDVTKRLLRDAGLNIAPFITLTRANRHNISFAEVKYKLGLPLFVKPANQGSSVGVSKVTSEEQYAIAVDLAFEFDHKVIVEQGIKGREIECAVLGNDNPQASTCGEIDTHQRFLCLRHQYIDEDWRESGSSGSHCARNQR